jgi:hypothetical protein
LDGTFPFRALCSDILGTRQAYLLAVGPLASLAGSPLAYPDDAPLPRLPASSLLASWSPQTIGVPLNPAHYDGLCWAVPLWSERGLIGVLLLGEKRDGGLYTQEEMEIARASGERLIDTQASVELARRLMALQRQRLAQTQILDRQTRRVLHDDILPSLHTAMLMLTADPFESRRLPSGKLRAGRRPIRQAQGRPPTTANVSFQNQKSRHRHASEIKNPHQEAVTLLTEVHHQISNLLREMPASLASEVSRLGLVGALHRIVEDELSQAFDEVTWAIEPEAEEKAQTIPTLTGEVLFYAAREAMRNAARHGRLEASNPLHLNIVITWQNGLELMIEDNGVGLGATGSANSSSGQGLALHSTMMAVVGGTLAVESAPRAYTRVILTLPQAI